MKQEHSLALRQVHDLRWPPLHAAYGGHAFLSFFNKSSETLQKFFRSI
jgi:hypothetical protein